MADQHDADLTIMEQVTADLIDAVAGIADGERYLQTPCSEWNLTDLVDHVTGGNWFTVEVLSGETAEAAMAATIARFADGPASPSDAADSAREQLEAIRGPGILDGTWDHVAGQLNGRQLLRLRLHDLIVHTWDINETRRRPASIPPALARWGLRELADDGSLMAEHVALPHSAGDPPLGDDPSARYLLALGRQPTIGQTDPG